MDDYKEKTIKTYLTERLEPAIKSYDKKLVFIVPGLLFLKLFRLLY